MSTVTTESPKERFSRIRSHLIRQEPWWASVLLQLKEVYTNKMPYGAGMATDGTHIFINTEGSIDAWSDAEYLAVIVHELGHVILLHMFRRNGRDMLPWNWACDEVVNAIVTEGAFILPKDCVPACPLDETAEDRFDKLPKNFQNLSQTMQQWLGDLIESGQMLDEDGNPVQAQNPAQAQQFWKEFLSTNRGTAPGSLHRQIDEALAPDVPFEVYVQKWWNSLKAAPRTTWNRPHRRLPGLIPGRRRPKEYNIAITVDTSGSMDTSNVSEAVACVRALCSMEGVKVTVIAADADVHAVYEPGEEWESFPGGGGTDFRPACAKAEELKLDGMFYVTDGEGTYPDECEVPLCWLLISRPSTMPTVGEVVEVKR